jgi:predicted 3-demethylubiquinone-9 3-methyltransferase (glyoxalase superfamily)
MPQKIIPNLWFDTEAEEAAAFYISIFENSRIVNVLLGGVRLGLRPRGVRG